MSVALWYYCNLHDEVSAVVPIVQARQNAVQGDLKVPVVRPAIALVSGTEVDDELDVARTTYVLSAALAEKVEREPVAEKKTVVDTKPVPVETVEVEAAVETIPEQKAVEVVEVEKVEEEAIEEAATEVVQEVVEKALVTEEEVAEPVVEDVVEYAAVEAVLEKTVEEVATVVEIVQDAVEAVTVEQEIVEPIVAQAEVEEEKPVEVEEPTAEPAASEEVTEEIVAEKEEVADAEAPASPILSSDVPDEKLLDKADDVMLDMIAEPRKLVKRMPSIPEDEESVVGVEDEGNADVDQVGEVAVAVEKTEEVGEDEELPAKPVTDDESETETQSEISEATAIEAVESAPVAKISEEPESEIDETMIIDPAVAAKEAAAVEAQTSSYSFIPEQLRKNSYAVSSVAVAVTTAIVATLVARR